MWSGRLELPNPQKRTKFLIKKPVPSHWKTTYGCQVLQVLQADELLRVLRTVGLVRLVADFGKRNSEFNLIVTGLGDPLAALRHYIFLIRVAVLLEQWYQAPLYSKTGSSPQWTQNPYTMDFVPPLNLSFPPTRPSFPVPPLRKISEVRHRTQ